MLRPRVMKESSKLEFIESDVCVLGLWTFWLLGRSVEYVYERSNVKEGEWQNEC